MFESLSKILPKIKIKSQVSVYYLSIVTGILAGLFAMGFSWMLEHAEIFFNSFRSDWHSLQFTFVEKAKFVSTHITSSIIIILLPALGGLISGLLSHFFCKEAVGTGADEMIGAFHNNEGNISKRVPFIKGIATIFTLSTGGSGGKEGPIALIGSGIGVIIAKITNAGARARRTLLLAGSAAGLGAVFKSPLGGALTAVEMVYKEDIESDALIPCFISSVVAYLFYTSYAGTDALLSIPDLGTFKIIELPFYLILGVLCFVFGYLFIRGFRDSKSFILKIKIHPILKPAIGGLFVGYLSLFFYEIAGTGDNYFGLINQGLYPNYFAQEGTIYMMIGSLLIIAFLKIVATTLTIGSGGSAGIFGPSLFIGAMLGAAVGLFAKFILDQHQVHVSSYIVVGMGAFYAGVANAPIAGIIMICEMSGSYALLPALILVSIFTFILSKKISFYKNQVENRFQSPAHFWDMKMDVIDNIKLSDIKNDLRRLAVLNENQSLNDAIDLSFKVHASDFCVYNNKNEYVGMLSLRKLDFHSEEVEFAKTNNIIQIINRNIPYLDTTMKLSQGLKIVTQYDHDKVAVVEKNKFLGYVRTRDILNKYSEKSNTLD